MEEQSNSVNRALIEYTYLLVVLTTFVACTSIISIFTMVYCCLKRRNSMFKSSASGNDMSPSAQHKIQEICIIPATIKPKLNDMKPQLSIIKSSTKSLIESNKTLFKKRRGSNNSLTINLDSPSKKKLAIVIPSSECLPANESSTQIASNPMDASQIISMSKENAFLFKEFFDIPLNQPESILIPGSGIKNRYKSIIPTELTRVRLPQRSKDPLGTYINANYISGYNNEPKAFIATQGPLSNTINDFWHMIWIENVKSVIMITRLKEKNKSKCELYIPENCDESMVYGDVCVNVINITYKPDYEIRQLKITYMGQIRTVYHYWYTTWPDHNVPENPEALIQLIKQVEQTNRKLNNIATQNNNNNFSFSFTENSCTNSIEELNSKSPILVHCSAGVGRTGCYIAASVGIQQIDAEDKIDLVRIVHQMRQQRGGMIQTLEQYEFVYQVIAYYCVYYKNFSQKTDSSSSSSSSLSSPKSPTSARLQAQSFTFNTPTIQ